MESDDRFLHSHRRDPAPGFARRLRERLRDVEDPAPRPLWRPLVAAAAALAVVMALFAFPAVRAGAQAMLDMFRVRNFVAVSFDPERLEKLRALKQNNAMLVFDRQQVIQDPGKPVVQPSVAAAGAVAGFTVESPSYLPRGLALDTVAVSGEGRAQIGTTTARLREVLDALGLNDVQVPPNLDTQDVTVHTYPVVSQSYRAERHHLQLVQSRNPEVGLPAGLDLARMAEIGLRILGVDTGEAHRLAQSIDWRSTLLVPVPTTASSFRQVTVQGNPGLLVTSNGEGANKQGRRRAGSVLMWTQGDRMFALEGTLGEQDLVQVAESVR
jgi:hypothetical protein